MIVGLTGGIGSGKSTVLHLFKELGHPCYIADTEAKRLMQEDAGLKSRIVSLLGEELITKERSIGLLLPKGYSLIKSYFSN